MACCPIGALLVCFPIGFAVEGAGYLVDLSIEGGHLVTLQLLGERLRQGFDVEIRVAFGDDEKLGYGAQDGMLGGDADAVGDARTGEGGILYFGGIDLVTTDIDDIVVAALQVEAAARVEEATVAGVDSTVVKDFLG